MIDIPFDFSWSGTEVFAAAPRAWRPFLLDDSGPLRSRRASVVGLMPRAELFWSRGRGMLRERGARPRRIEGLLEGIRLLQSRCEAAVPFADAPFFSGGILGYLGYDLRTAFEDLDDSLPAETSLPDAWLGAYDLVIALDEERHPGRARLLELDGGPGPSARGRSVLERLRGIESFVRPYAAPRPVPATPSMRRRDHEDAAERIRESIRAGAVYQVNLTQRFLAPCAAAPEELFEALRRRHPAPCAALFGLGDAALISVSPETFLRFEGERLESRPIKGTAARAREPEADRARARALLASEKDRAELTMIVDLVRNDLARCCRPGSVVVEDHAHLESAPTVHHLVTAVRGRLREGRDLADALAASLPAGSITGAPKIAAMRTIEAIEAVRRGPYTGVFGHLGAGGRGELAVAIRTLVLEGGYARVHGGGGIVIDSDPVAEYDEAVAKVRGILEVLGAEVVE